MARLVELPVEILQGIAKLLSKQKDLTKLCLVSQYLYDVVAPVLYERLTIVPPSEVELAAFDVQNTLSSSHTARRPLRHTRHIEFTRYFPPGQWENYNQYTESDCDVGLDGLIKALAPVLEACRDDSLQSFVWGLGTCFPEKVFQASGYLSTRQKMIESLKIITHPFCNHRLFESPTDLSAFTHLKRLSWGGLWTLSDRETLKQSLRHFSNQLVELDLIIWNGRYRWGDVCWQEFMQLPSHSTPLMFPALQSLSLSHVRFPPNIDETAYYFDFGSLCSLKLVCCENWQAFLECGSSTGQRNSLKSFTFQEYSSKGRDIFDGPLVDFLESFTGLEELVIFVDPSDADQYNALRIRRAILRHEKGLRTLVLHQGGCIRAWGLLGMSNPVLVDIGSGWSSKAQKADNWEKDDWYDSFDTSQHPLDGLNLTFIAISQGIDYLKLLLCPSLKLSIRIIHFRTSGADDEYYYGIYWENGVLRTSSSIGGMEDPTASMNSERYGSYWPSTPNPVRRFSQWAFGPRGMPSLDVIVHGDFSQHGRYERTNLFLCRNSGQHRVEELEEAGQTFRRFSRQDRIYEDLLEQYADVLATCSTNSSWTPTP